MAVQLCFIYAAVILVIAQGYLVESQVVKRGTCPAASPNPGPCLYNLKVNCFGDSCCPGSMKCCRDWCGQVCKLPCPIRNCDHKCREYIKDAKGCSTCLCKVPICPSIKCALYCERYVLDKDGCIICQCEQPTKGGGTCPAVHPRLGPCVHGQKDSCLKDSECPDILMCCPVGCGRLCKLPCPPRRCDQRCKEYAQDARGCFTCRCQIPLCSSIKCAVNCKRYVLDKNGCRTCQCMPTLKYGACPYPSPNPGPCLYNPTANCLDDSACPGAEKCCSEGCGRVCKLPCPRSRCYRRCRKYAKDARGCLTCRCEISFCPLIKCAVYCKAYILDRNGCRTCHCAQKIKPGVCPKSPDVRCVQAIFECIKDEDCSSDKKCCGFPCGTKCLSPLKRGDYLSADYLKC